MTKQLLGTIKKTFIAAFMLAFAYNQAQAQLTITFANGNFTYAPKISSIAVNDVVTFNGNFASHPLQEVSKASWCANSNSPAIGPVINTGTSYSGLNTSTSGDRYFVCVPHSGLGMKCKISIGCNTPAPTGNTAQTVATGATLADLVVSGTGINWYTGAGVECPIPAATTIASGTTYYATQTVGNCESSTYLAVTPTICTTPNAFTVTGGGIYCVGGAGVSIGLSNTQSGINYQVKDGGGNNVGASIPGSGTPANFGNITVAGTYTVEATNTSGGCTATMVGSATVTVKQPTTSNFSTTACDSYTWQGTTYTTTGTYNSTITNAAGCDSVMILNLTINNATTSTATATACNNYMWQGTNYTATGTYSATITNVAGCDSVITLNLTINNSTTSSATVTACNNYMWQGTNYTATGTYSDTITNVAGCDSVMTLNLTINNSTTSSATVTACNIYMWQGTNYTATGTYSDTITNVAGCDSIMVLNLTITNLDLTTTVNNTTVTANQAGAMYQWIECTNSDSVIVGETNMSFTAINTGSYAVIIFVGNCVDTSACVNIITVGKNKLSEKVLTTVYPNPSTGSITLTSNATTTQNISIVNNIGQTVYTGIMSATQEVDMSSFASGIYTIQITSPTHLQHIKLIKQ